MHIRAIQVIGVVLLWTTVACAGGDADGRGFHDCRVEYSPDWETWKSEVAYHHQEPEKCPVLVDYQGQTRYHAGTIIESSDLWGASALTIYNAINQPIADDYTRFRQLEDGSWAAFINESYPAGTYHGDDTAYHQLAEAKVNASPKATIYLTHQWGGSYDSARITFPTGDTDGDSFSKPRRPDPPRGF